MGKVYKDLKFEEKTVIKFRQLKNLKEFDSREKITMTDLLEELMKNEFKKFDSKLIDWVYKKSK